MSRLSLRWRLVLVLVAFTAVVLLVQDLPLAAYLRTVEQDRIVTGLQRDAFTLAGQSEEALHDPTRASVAAVQAAVDTYARDTGARVVVVDENGVVLSASVPGDIGQSFSNRPEVTGALGGQIASGQRGSTTAGTDLLYVAVPVRSGSEILGAVRLTYPADEVDTAVDSRVRGLLYVGLISLAAAVGIALLVATAVTRRLRRLQVAAEAVAAGDLSARADVDDATELGAVADSFNTMAARIERLVDAQRGFAGDASHQLRTPLTALRLRLERADDAVGSDPDAAHEALDAALVETDRLQNLVEGLLLLARSEGGRTARARVDLAAAVRDRADTWSPLAEERGVRLAAVVPPGRLEVWALPGAVEQVVDNYVDNALGVAPAGSSVTVSVRDSGAWVRLSVEDEGPGLDAEQRLHAFDRFWRGSTDGEGSGLGLAVVRALAIASDGEVWLEPRDSGGLRAVARFRTAGHHAP